MCCSDATYLWQGGHAHAHTPSTLAHMHTHINMSAGSTRIV